MSDDKPSFFDKYRLPDAKQFSEEQIRYLTSRDTLQRWATKSLLERVSMFKRRYPTSKVTVYKLRKLYAERKIRKKCIRRAKIPERKTREEIVMQAADLSQDVSMALERGFRVVQLDECLVTTRTLPTHVWTLPKSNAEIDLSWIKSPCKAILLAVSREYGMENVEVYNNSINK